MKQLSINIYSFHELSEKGKTRAIEDHRAFMLSTLQPDYIDGVTDWNDPEKMAMYRAECSAIEDSDTEVVESIEVNEYMFYANGELCPCCTYVAGPKQGTTEATIHGEVYTMPA